MTTKPVKNIHKTAGILALVVIFIFFSFSLYAELIGNHETIKIVKTGILYGMILLFLIMPVTVITGRKLAGYVESPIGR